MQLKFSDRARISARRIGGAAVAMAVGLGVAAGAASASTSHRSAHAAAKPIMVGMDADLTGVDASEGQGLKEGAQAYFNAIDKHGGVDGHPIKLEALSDNDAGDTAIANVVRLAKSFHVSGLIGFQSSVPIQAAAPTAARYKIPVIASTVSKGLVVPTEPYLFALTIETSENAGPDVAMAKQLMGKKSGVKFATLTTAGFPALTQWQDGVVTGAKALGWNPVSNEQAPFPAVDASTTVSSIIAADPDILINGLGEDAWLVSEMKQLSAAGASFPVVEYDSSDWATIQSIGSPNLYYTTALAFPTKKATPQFWADAKASKVDPNGVYVERGYLEALVVGDGLQACGYPCSGQKLAKVLNKANYNTGGITIGNVQYSAKNHQAVSYERAYKWSPSSAPAPTAVGPKLHIGTH